VEIEMPEPLVTIEITRGLLRAAWVAFFVVGFFFIVSLLSYLKMMRSLSLQLDFLIYIKSLLQEIRSAMGESGGAMTLEDLDRSREPPTRPAPPTGSAQAGPPGEGPKGGKG
jgi:hypothetical protein